MRKRVKALLGRIGLTIKFSIMIFIILCLAAFISGTLVHLSIQVGVFSEQTLTNPKIIPVVILITCTILGTIFATIASHSTVKMVEKFIAASNQVASGDFSARLDIKCHGEFKIIAENFNQMAKELGSIEVLRTDFINNFSHEFKTPIVSIKGFAEILKYDDLTAEEREEYLNIVIEESSRLAALSSNVLELSKIEQQGILSQKQKFNLGEQIRQCVLLLESEISKKEIELDLNIQDYTVNGNKEMMSQVWVNLLNNAVKFTDSKGFISIKMNKDESHISVEIRDTGCGISKEALPRIFDKFYQADSSHATKGNGLGLVMVKRIIELHKGSIACESELSKGTAFKITLPIGE